MDDIDIDRIIQITYDVAKEQIGRNKAFDVTLAKTLAVNGLYQVRKIVRHFFLFWYSTFYILWVIASFDRITNFYFIGMARRRK